ncbi:hypothetical protein DL546_006939 [Coniochaeta pulveracea]|uniref:Uncharacterized protein n=1 Tax=Coniochaeta pulveracea TaxID=177199 RepID=A0A420YET4_9PEZI|nr:hypothetical protein DL546_006939 [Coniochaeta pulveracea]
MEPRTWSAANSPGPSSSAFEDAIRQTTLRWLKNYTNQAFQVEDFCSFLSAYLAEGATCLEEIQAVTEAEVLRLCGPSMHKIGNDNVLRFVDESSGANQDLDTGLGEAEVAHDLVLAAIRYLNLTDWNPVPGEYVHQLPIIQRRSQEHPFYRVAAKTWPDLVRRFPDSVPRSVRDEACRLFSSVRHGNFVSWFIELMTTDDADAATYDLIRNLLAESVSPLHIAAFLHLGFICEAAIQQGYGVNQKSRIGTPLYCILVPLICSSRGSKWTQIRRGGRIPDQAERSLKTTFQVLRDAGAEISDETAYMRVPGRLSYSSAVLMLSAMLQDLDFFTSLTRPEHYLTDREFIGVIEDIDFPFPVSEARDGGTMIYLDGLCGFLIDQSWKPRFRKMWGTAWRKAIQCRVRCGKVKVKRSLMLSEEDAAAFCDEILRDGSKSQLHLIRWIQHGQKEANFVTDAEDGETLLHHAVSEDKSRVVKLLVQGANVDISVRDKQGRTPLHFCEGNSAVLSVLISNGADLASTDDDGRTIWHYAAANADLDLLKALMDADKNRDESLKGTTKIGRTPLAEAFAYVRELVGLGPGGQERMPPPAIEYLLQHCRHDPAYLQSDIPLLCYVAEWGCMRHQQHTLLSSLLDTYGSSHLIMFGQTASDGSGPLHYLNLSVSQELILGLKAVPGVSEQPVLNHAGLSPAETIFLAFKPSADVYDGPTAHPSWNQWMDEDAYLTLLSDEVISSRDQHGRTLWPRFCANVLVHYCHDERVGFVEYIEPSLYIAMTCFRRRGVFEAFDNPRRVFWEAMGQRSTPDWVSPILDRLPLGRDDI